MRNGDRSHFLGNLFQPTMSVGVKYSYMASYAEYVSKHGALLADKLSGSIFTECALCRWPNLHQRWWKASNLTHYVSMSPPHAYIVLQLYIHVFWSIHTFHSHLTRVSLYSFDAHIPLTPRFLHIHITPSESDTPIYNKPFLNNLNKSWHKH